MINYFKSQKIYKGKSHAVVDPFSGFVIMSIPNSPGSSEQYDIENLTPVLHIHIGYF